MGDDSINQQYFPELDEAKCPCRGAGWIKVKPEVWNECPVHFEGQLHPEEKCLLLDEPGKLAIEENKSHIQYQIKMAKENVAELQKQLKDAHIKLLSLELELINSTPTVKGMPAVYYDPDGDFT